jgi:acyl-CoA synthetase (AMP-forming)/AMP-acid ligase II
MPVQRQFKFRSPLEIYAPAKFESIPDAMARLASLDPARHLMVCEGRRVTRGEFGQRANRVANALLDMGLAHGDNVAILAPTSIEYLEVMIGTLRAGCCAVPLSGMSTPGQLKDMIDDSDARALFLGGDMGAGLAPVLAQLRGLLPSGLIALEAGAPGQPYEAWLARAPENAPGVKIAPDDAFNIIYSSGTTGVPKGILHDHALRWGVTHRLASAGFDDTTISITSTPLYSNTTAAGFYPVLATGGSLVLMKKFDAGRFLQLSQAERITHAMLVPVQIQRILAHPDFARTDLSSFRAKFCTSSPLQPDLKREAATRWPGGLMDNYGMTEGGVSCTLDVKAFPHKLHTVGKPAVGVDVRIIDAQGREVAKGEIGEIVGRGATMMVGYHKLPEKTTEILWESPEGELYFRSGDMGRFDEDGFLVLLDRKKDMIISGGFNVYAADLEAVLHQHSDVAESAVIGVPSEQWGEMPLALVVKRPGATIGTDELRDWANAKLGKLQRIAMLEFREELPRSSMGKVLKKELRAPYWEKTGRQI